MTNVMSALISAITENGRDVWWGVTHLKKGASVILLAYLSSSLMLICFESENMSMLRNAFFILPPDTPTQAGPENIFYDFNDGARVLLPEGKWHVRLLDADSKIFFSVAMWIKAG